MNIMTMRRFAQLSLAFVGAVAITACANDGNMDTTTGATGTTGTAGTSADIDRGFINEQLEDGGHQVRLGRLAEERGQNADVRAFGRMMAEDHTRAGAELKRIAGRHGLTHETSDQPGAVDGDGLFDRLSQLEGAEFDRAYMDAMVDEHEEAVDDLEDKADNTGEHADVKAWASETLPKVREHLERARELREGLRHNM